MSISMLFFGARVFYSFIVMVSCSEFSSLIVDMIYCENGKTLVIGGENVHQDFKSFRWLLFYGIKDKFNLRLKKTALRSTFKWSSVICTCC